MHIALFQLLRCNTEFDGKSKTFMALNDVYVLQISQGHLVLNEIIQVCFRVSFEAIRTYFGRVMRSYKTTD